MPELTTACDRLAYAEERLKTEGWERYGLRAYSSDELYLSGPACLLGSLVSDEEMQKLKEIAPSNISTTYDAIYNGELPGLNAAIYALGFSCGRAVYDWNDIFARDKADVISRVQTARKQHCP